MSRASWKAAPMAARNQSARQPALSCRRPSPSHQRHRVVAPTLQDMCHPCTMVGPEHSTVFPPASAWRHGRPQVQGIRGLSRCLWFPLIPAPLLSTCRACQRPAALHSIQSAAADSAAVIWLRIHAPGSKDSWKLMDQRGWKWKMAPCPAVDCCEQCPHVALLEPRRLASGEGTASCDRMPQTKCCAALWASAL